MSKLNKKKLEARKLSIVRKYTEYAPGSVLISYGGTKVICSASIEERVPPFLRNEGTGWLTAEYSMIPSSTFPRARREVSKGSVSGRTNEIQRLIGRSLRSILDLPLLGERTIYIDADVIQADGGTRTASITGGMIALIDAIKFLMDNKMINENPVKEFIAAISVGIVDGEVVCDLCYEEDSRAEVDMNVVMTESGRYVEIQGTAENEPFSKEQLNQMLSAGEDAILKTIKHMKSIL